MTTGTQRRVLVLGGGTAGLLTAHVLAEYADSVTVLERDALPPGPEHRPGVPQGHHLHVVLPGGQRALDELLPGVVRELCAHGAFRIGVPRDAVLWSAGSWARRFPATMHLLSCTRPLLDWVVRERVRKHRRIRLVERTAAVALLGDATRVSGVRAAPRDTVPRDPYDLRAALVVDATGRSSAAPEWLAALGRAAPPAECVDPGLAYTTLQYKGAPGNDSPYQGVHIQPDRDHPRGAALFPVEADRWLLTVYGMRGHEPPTDEAGVLRFLGGLPDPVLHEWARRNGPAAPPRGFRATANRRYLYERAGTAPAGFLAVGDACCTFNPIYAQGVSVAALQAVALRAALSRSRPRGRTTTRTLQRVLSTASRPAWQLATGADLQYPATTGNRPGVTALPQQWYLDRILARANGNRVIGDAFRDVIGLTAPPARLFTPKVAAAALFAPVPQALTALPLHAEP
ncbi:NAD(P)/FAD-dependent oxidoreductase [Streptomyces sp. NPDC053542]|uniref:NAD(P)/FAD-dependent oxidoreductase n=1 Tax=Streptomyces sp. NPDC053542 TaxID=3365710 RepID=UPI0037D3F2EA